MQSPMMQCPKCRGVMRTYDRSGVHIEQCENCRGVFLDYGELEALAQIETRYAQPMQPPPASYGHSGPPPAAYGAPGWGGQHPRGKHKKSWAHAIFSS